MNDEYFSFDITVDQDKLIDYFHSLVQKDINDTVVSHKEEFEKIYNYKIEGTTVKEFKKELPFTTHLRKDLVSKCNENDPNISNICKFVREKIPGAEFGLIAFFFQRKGEDVELHQDFPYRKNSLLMIPLFGESKYDLPKSNAVTYYKDGGEYQVLSPAIVNVMKSHGVRNVDQDRLMLHLEIPNLTIEQIKRRIL